MADQQRSIHRSCQAEFESGTLNGVDLGIGAQSCRSKAEIGFGPRVCVGRSVGVDHIPQVALCMWRLEPQNLKATGQTPIYETMRWSRCSPGCAADPGLRD